MTLIDFKHLLNNETFFWWIPQPLQQEQTETVVDDNKTWIAFKFL